MTGITSGCLIIRFFDLRDALEYMLESAPSTLLHEHASIPTYFVDESVIPILREIGWPELDFVKDSILSPTNQGTICLTLDFPACFDGREVPVAISNLLNTFMAFGKILAYSDGWRDNQLPNHTVKLFIEYFDCHAAEYAVGRSKHLFHEFEFKVAVQFCILHHSDKDFLFFHQATVKTDPVIQDGCISTPTSLSSEAKIIRRPGKHQRSFSTISNTFSTLSILSEIESLSANSYPTKCSDSEADESHDFPLHKETHKIDKRRIENGQDGRTTCMIKNIPNKYTQQMLIDHLDESHAGRYDFIYLRMDFKNRCNVGYAFINFLHPSDILSLGKRMEGQRWPRFNSEKRCELAYARIQGREALVEKFKHSRVMQEPPSYRPRVFDCSGSRK